MSFLRWTVWKNYESLLIFNPDLSDPGWLIPYSNTYTDVGFTTQKLSENLPTNCQDSGPWIFAEHEDAAEE